MASQPLPQVRDEGRDRLLERGDGRVLGHLNGPVGFVGLNLLVQLARFLPQLAAAWRSADTSARIAAMRAWSEEDERTKGHVT